MKSADDMRSFHIGRAARRRRAGAHVIFFLEADPPDADLLTSIRELRTRYEDDPDGRGATAEEIIGRLRACSTRTAHDVDR